MSKEKWIQGMHMKKGALHKELGIKSDKKIPKKTLEKASNSKNKKLSKRANLALTLEGFHR